MAKETATTLEDAIISCGAPVDPQLSPDGQWLTWAYRPYGQEEDHPEGSIWFAPSDGSRPGRRITFGGGQDTMSRWAPDGLAIAFLSDRAERGTLGLYFMRADGGEARGLVKRKSAIDTFAWSPDGRMIAFLSPDEPTDEDRRRDDERDDPEVYGERWRYSRLHLVELESGETRTLPTGEQHVFDLAWSPDSTRVAFVARPTPEIDSTHRAAVHVIGIDDDSPEHVCATPGRMIVSLTWTLDGRHLTFLSGHDETISALTVYAVDPSGGEPRVVGPSSTEDACAIGISAAPGESRLVAAIAQGLTTRLEWLDPATGARESLFEPQTGDISPDASVNVAGGGNPVLAVVHSSGEQPPEMNVGGPGCLTRISDHHAALSEFRFGAQEPFYWTSEDGLDLDGVLIRPPDAGEGPLPTVVHIHGGPYGRFSDGWSFNPVHWAQWLAVHGFAVLMPNYRGGVGHGDRFAKWAYQGVGGKEFDDLMTAVDAAVERGIADPDRLGIGGWSQGGFLTAWSVTQTNRFKAGIVGAGVTDWGMMAMTNDIPTAEAMFVGDVPWDGPGPSQWQRRSPIAYARNVETPVLILHGKNDQRVPVTQAVGFHRALMDAGVTSEFVVYPREFHGIGERNHQRDMLRRVRDWFQRWL